MRKGEWVTWGGGDTVGEATNEIGEVGDVGPISEWTAGGGITREDDDIVCVGCNWNCSGGVLLSFICDNDGKDDTNRDDMMLRKSWRRIEEKGGEFLGERRVVYDEERTFLKLEDTSW